MDGEPSDLKFHLSRPDRQLLFDRRYGWIFDEWKDPAEEALAGGRGMFCVVPVAKALLKMASQSVTPQVEIPQTLQQDSQARTTGPEGTVPSLPSVTDVSVMRH
ncbi:hypothetical protein KSP40_PGU003140 [Platanthera guangdongensis]|uniref:Uncharacterized protein n=1 Tax=Platanthera guangdongensis TaxID=2320717 RepID=A0ABR2MD38_9ASPA